MEGKGNGGKRKKKRIESGMVRAVLKRNRMQAAALALTYALTFALLVLLTFFYPSIETTFDWYLEEYRLPEATIITEMIPRKTAEDVMAADGIRASSASVVVEAQTLFENGKTVSCRFRSVPETSEERFYSVVGKEDAVPGGDGVLISSYFAAHNDIAPGDRMTVYTYLRQKELTITDVVSSPETISTNRNLFSWYDSNDFAYVFVGEALMDELFACGNYANRIDMWFEDGADAGQLLADAENRLGSAVVYAGTYEGSETQKQIRGALDGTKAIVSYMPVLLIGMGILFSTLFFIQIVNRGEKQNGLMMAIGYDMRRICRIYVRCAVRLTLLSAVFGFALGAVLLRLMLQIYVSTYDLPLVCYAGSLLSLPLLLAAIVLIGVVSSLLSCLRLGKLDPARIFGNLSTEKTGELPKWLGRVRVRAFVKMSLCQIYRNRRRFWLSVLCGMACLLLTFLSLSVINSKNESIRYLFEERFLYDLSVRCDTEAALDAVASLPGVKRSEQVIDIAGSYEDEAIVLEALPENPELTGIMSVKGEKLSVPPQGILIEEGFARRHRLSEGDELVLDGVSLRVQGITREYYNSIQYISFDTAALLGEDKANTLLLVLDEERDKNGFISLAAKEAGYLYYCDRESRRSCVEAVLSALDLPCYVFALFGVIIGAVIVSTMNLVTIAQRRKKYASLYVLGASESDFLGLELPETVLQFAATVLFGIAPAILCTRYMLREMSAPSQEFVAVYPVQTSIVSAAVVAVYLLIGVLVTLGAIRKMKYLEVLSEK